jgi:hypothetical protein
MSRKHKAFRVASGVIAVVGFVFLLGTAGASDLGNIADSRTAAQALIGVVLFVAGTAASGGGHES